MAWRELADLGSLKPSTPATIVSLIALPCREEESMIEQSELGQATGFTVEFVQVGFPLTGLELRKVVRQEPPSTR